MMKLQRLTCISAIALLFLTGCANHHYVARYLTNSVWSPIEDLGKDKVKFYDVDEFYFEGAEPVARDVSFLPKGAEVIVMQCAEDENGITKFGTIYNDYDQGRPFPDIEVIGTDEFQAKAAKWIPDCLPF
ncbi:hypothetical protein [Canibacter zhoujuaniae]|uniref:hypothetical protein n=1 Tax=Canibacter zhoujuaniae TaxID=2708343 RepID=UPI00141EC825|nr:hypothetical protein [Canibacter zhoujuaniae]